MAASIAEHFLTAIREERDFIPIPVGSLRLDTITGFDLYLAVHSDEPPVLYAKHDVPFGEASRQRLVESRVEHLYISALQQGKYRRYLEHNLSAILSDASIPPESKSEILYTSAHGLMRELFDNPELQEGISRSQEVVSGIVDLLYVERTALRHLIETAARDYNLYTHAVNGCVLGLALAQRVGFGLARQLNAFGRGALLRDIGMTQVDASIRECDGKLTASQFDELKLHPLMSEAMLSEAGEQDTSVLELARHHHEKLDGRGYPDGLKGGTIPPMVRIMTIVDIFDALTTERAYVPSISSFEALRLMSNDLAGELDQGYFKAFIGMLGNPG